MSNAKTPHEQESIQRQIIANDKQIDALVYELYGLTEGEMRIVDGEPAQMTTEAWGASRTANDEAP